ncbi:MAG: hypothetical protein ONB48_20220 [candidate division KSB1 bacterium]|nr:hypothetical protein [candidate division KSB1 bacterium]MDZ7276220.1 hypothetical protein [candidate division KSB1 bacterium]MDZ7287974.1 hypothetical protein [candidate division KSB1 bacterium]MDZ7300013.1 hypothetical protein [candidate division KSB1 bacterium]MDZ7308234.1 hypothetical protein [candidate division KSB1 bacterium]
MTILPVALLLLMLLSLPLPAYSQKSKYLDCITAAVEHAWARHPEVIAAWKARIDPSELWGYNPPAEPLYLADALGFLHQQTGEKIHAARAAQLLAGYGDLRQTYPGDYAKTRAEYGNGIPALANFFFLPPYVRAYLRIRTSGVLDDDTRTKIESDLAHSLDFVFHFPEWGAHNRAMLRAEGLYYGSLALPNHPHAARWRQMAETIASDNLRQWEIEDAGLYHPIWLLSLFTYADLSGRETLFDSPLIRYYAEYFKRLFTPAYNFPDFGDANWNPTWDRYLAVCERLATRYRDPELKWVAERMFEKMTALPSQTGIGAASSLALAYQWSDDNLAVRPPQSLSQEVLDDVVGKKIVFRNGWQPGSTYLLLNYRDEGEGGFVHREFLRHTLSVEEEKMHHGHADENDISLLMSGGSVLLHDGGYRDGLPSGPYGQFRADYFHNRLVVRLNKRDRQQPLQEFVRHSGAYRPVRTRKIDFLTLHAVDMSRTRLEDEALGYAWDRIITYLKEQNLFIVIDAVEVKRTDYYTFTNFWHTRKILEQGEDYFVTAIDAIGAITLPQNERLLLRFLETHAKTAGTHAETRHYQDEIAIYQTQSSHYLAGDYEIFVTALIPLKAGERAADKLPGLRLLPLAAFPAAVGVELKERDRVSYLCVKIDLHAELVRENIRPRYTWESGRVSYGEVETDAHFAFVTRTGDTLHYSASEVLKMIYRGRVLLEALPNTHGLQLDGAPPRVGYVKWRYWEDSVVLK